MKVAKVNGRTIAISDNAYGIGGSATLPFLSQLPDVDISTLADGDVLIWNESTLKWEAGPAATGDFLLTTGGGQGVVSSLGSLGSTETIDVTDANYFYGTLDDDVTIDFTGWTTGKDSAITVELTEDGTGGWAPTFTGVTWLGGTTPTHDTTLGTRTLYIFMSRDGGTTILGGQLGGGSGSSLTIKDEGTPLTTAATSIDFVGAGVTASGATAAKTVTIAGVTEAAVQAVGHYEVMMDGGSPPAALESGSGTDWLYVWVYP